MSCNFLHVNFEEFVLYLDNFEFLDNFMFQSHSWDTYVPYVWLKGVPCVLWWCTFPSCFPPLRWPHLCCVICPTLTCPITSSLLVHLSPLASFCSLSDHYSTWYSCFCPFLAVPCVSLCFVFGWISGLWTLNILDVCLCFFWFRLPIWTDVSVLTLPCHTTIEIYLVPI